VQRDREWGLRSDLHTFVAATPFSSCRGLLTLCPCCSVRSLSRETVLHKLLQCESFPQGAVLQAQTTPAWVPHGVTSPASKPVPVWPPLSPWGHRSCQEPAPARASHELTVSFGHPPALGWGPPRGCRWRSAPQWTSVSCRITACFTMVFTTGWRGSPAPASGAPAPAPYSLTLLSAELFPSCSLTPLS